MGADYVGALGLGHPMNDFRGCWAPTKQFQRVLSTKWTISEGAEHPLNFPYIQFNF
jgi:hypothetical protein